MIWKENDEEPEIYAILGRDMRTRNYERLSETEPVRGRSEDSEVGRMLLRATELAEAAMAAEQQAVQEEQLAGENDDKSESYFIVDHTNGANRDIVTDTNAATESAKPEPIASPLGQSTKPAPERVPGPMRPITSIYMKVEDFEGVYPESKLRRDERYVRDYRHDLGAYEYSEASSKQFEELFIRGVQVGRWLGNINRKRQEGEGAGGFVTQTFETADYDDIRHRVDAFTIMKFDKPVETDAEMSLRTLPLGFDLTLSSDRTTILDKLTRSCNDNAVLPFGFTHIDYFTDGRRRMECPLLPRYVIGINEHEIFGLNRQTRENARWQGAGLLTKQNLRTRFRILSEIRAQNELFEAMLPEDAYDNPSENIRIAQSYIEVADRELNHALVRCAHDMVQYKALPEKVVTEIEENPLRTRSIIEDYLIWEGKKYYHKNRRAQMGDVADNPAYSDTFVQIMTQVRRLTEAARNGGSGKFPLIENLKAEQPRNKVIFGNQKKKGIRYEDRRGLA